MTLGGNLHRLRSVVGRGVRFCRPLRFPLLLGLIFRFALSPMSQMADDYTFASIGMAQAFGGGPYTFPNNYPPAWNLILGVTARGVTLFIPPNAVLFHTGLNFVLRSNLGLWEPLYMVSPAFMVAEKSLLIVFDVLTGLLLYHMVRTAGYRDMDPKLVFMLWFLNPLTIFESSVHGAYDVIPTFFALLGLYFLQRQEAPWSGLSIGLSIAFKLFALFLIPVLLVLFWRKVAGKFRTSMLFLGGVATGLLAAFWIPGVVVDYFTYSFFGNNVGASYGGLWIWSVTSLPGSGSSLAMWLTLHSSAIGWISLGAATLGALLVAALPRYLRSYQEPELLIYSVLFLFAIMASYFASAVTQPEYLIWLLPFMGVVAAMARSLRFVFLTLSVLCVLFLNLMIGPLYFWQPLTYFLGFPGQTLVVSSSLYFYSIEYLTFPLLLISAFAFLVLFLLLTIQKLPQLVRKVHAP